MNFSTYLRGAVRVPRSQGHCSAWNLLQRGTDTDRGNFFAEASNGVLSAVAPQVLGLFPSPLVPGEDPGPLLSHTT